MGVGGIDMDVSPLNEASSFNTVTDRSEGPKDKAPSAGIAGTHSGYSTVPRDPQEREKARAEAYEKYENVRHGSYSSWELQEAEAQRAFSRMFEIDIQNALDK